MKTIAVAVLLVAFACAEPPLSNSYLPPPSSSRGAGYPQGPANQNFGPQIVAARTLDGAQGRAGHGAHAHGGHGAQANGFGRSAQDHGAAAHARHGAEEPAGYPNSAARNALEELNSEPADYNFGYMVNDYQEGTDFGHHEERQDERAQGEYHVVLPDGRKQTVSYEADERGFKPQISYEDSEDLARSGGYDGNANNARSNQANGYSNHGNHGNDNGYHGNDNGYHGNGNARANGY
ncbi:pro-resilin-like isoform X1 [Spodoptera frugiperda]|uniref:Pro-resilin-like isoform X1 n=1 Tax=Spodoptera frugiperda TaxID=7108 RepID=A0A9R0DYA5_SPOFR|nr:pro-resilin-like isoform X1 [Spodoptera frugiperda]